ncbi:MAG: CPBP family intramembrane glutamic endopeptidase [Alphaproteobacteria bacterium]
MIEHESNGAFARLPLLLFPIILFSLIGLDSGFALLVKALHLDLIGGAIGWLLAPHRVGAVGYVLSGLLVCGLIWAWASRNGIVDRIIPFKAPSFKDWAWALLGFFASTAIAYALLPIINSIGPVRGRDYNLHDPAMFALISVYAVLVGPALEEIVFRGFGIGYLVGRGLNRWLAGLIVLALFVVMHWPVFGAAAMLLVLPVSILITVFRILSGSLTPGLMLHMLNNFLAFIVLPLLWPHPTG